VRPGKLRRPAVELQGCGHAVGGGDDLLCRPVEFTCQTARILLQ